MPQNICKVSFSAHSYSRTKYSFLYIELIFILKQGLIRRERQEAIIKKIGNKNTNDGNLKKEEED